MVDSKGGKTETGGSLKTPSLTCVYSVKWITRVFHPRCVDLVS
jgi:hypothetical protein